MAQRGMKFGIFLAPFHRLGENPTLAMARDMELVEWLDWLGYDEAWIGEHHSAGWEIIASPEIFIGLAADRTRHIKLGSGVTSLPYHHPFLVAQRFVQLDHMTRGRVMLGCGPGALPSDAYMMGIEPVHLRRSTARAWTGRPGASSSACTLPRTTSRHCVRSRPASGSRPRAISRRRWAGYPAPRMTRCATGSRR